MLNKSNKQKGAVTIEATISLTAFMFAIITILSIVNIAFVQAKMAYAINMTAKEISQYSYLYALTGLNESQKNVYDNGLNDTKDIGTIIDNVSLVYSEIENVCSEERKVVGNPSLDGLLNAWDNIGNSVETIESAGSTIYDSMSDIADDPKKVMFGIAKLAGSKGFDLAKSRLIAAPLAKTMVKRHLVSSKNDDVEKFLKGLRVVPNAKGSYLGGLNFKNSTLFPNGSNLIEINVEYDVKVLELLPLDLKLHFCQTATTNGWLAGEFTYKPSKEYINNETLWTLASVKERSNTIRHAHVELAPDGFYNISGIDNVQLYSPDENEFIMISSMNPLWSAKGEKPKTLDDIEEEAVQKALEKIAGKMRKNTSSRKTVTTKKKKFEQTIKEKHNCEDASERIILVIPEDEGLKEKLQSIINKSNTKGVNIELVAKYGKGVNSFVKGEE